MIFSITTIIFCFLFFATLSAYLITKVPNQYWFKFFLIPVVFIITFILTTTIPELLGQPYQGYPTKEFVYLGHRKIGTKIDLWVIEKHGNNVSSRLYEFDFNSNIQAKLNTALLALQQGQTTIGKFHGQGKNGLMPNSVSDEDIRLDIKQFNAHITLPPKQPYEGNIQ